MCTKSRNHQMLFFVLNVRQQILMAFLLLTLVPVAIISVLSIIHERKRLLEAYESLISAESTRISSTLFDITLSMYTSCEPLLSQDSYRQLFAVDSYDRNSSDTYDILENILATMHTTNASVSDIAIYTNNPNIPTGNYIHSCAEDYAGMEWYENLMSAPNNISHWDYTCTTTAHPVQTLNEPTLTRRFALPSTQYSAYVVITINYEYIRSRLLYTDYYVLVALNDRSVFLSSDSNRTETPFLFSEEISGGNYHYSGALEINGSEKLAVISTFTPYMTDDKFYIMVSDLSAYDNINQITKNYFLISAVAFLFPTILIVVFSSYFSSRINTLRQAMHQASLENYNIITQFSGNDELALIFEDLQNTINVIRDKEAQLYKNKITEQQMLNRQQQMEFKMLASQINPHFLYNTLEAIRMQALSNGDKNVAKSVKLLGKSMHYVLENTGTNATTLDREIDYVKVYLSIQQIRFPDQINYVINIDEQILPGRCRILPLLLQPVVENAVVHGLEGMKDGFITIFVKLRDSTFIEITVQDNGSGIKEASLKALINHINFGDTEGSSSIGLYNVSQRIRLCYGDQYGVTINSRQGHGTSVILTLPFILQSD